MVWFTVTPTCESWCSHALVLYHCNILRSFGEWIIFVTQILTSQIIKRPHRRVFSWWSLGNCSKWCKLKHLCLSCFQYESHTHQEHGGAGAGAGMLHCPSLGAPNKTWVHSHLTLCMIVSVVITRVRERERERAEVACLLPQLSAKLMQYGLCGVGTNSPSPQKISGCRWPTWRLLFTSVTLRPPKDGYKIMAEYGAWERRRRTASFFIVMPCAK